HRGKMLLNRGLELRPPLEGLTQPAAAFQVAEHGFGNYVDRLTVGGPLELLLAGAQVLQEVLEPEQVRLALAHALTYLSQRSSSCTSVCNPCAKRSPRPAVISKCQIGLGLWPRKWRRIFRLKPWRLQFLPTTRRRVVRKDTRRPKSFKIWLLFSLSPAHPTCPANSERHGPAQGDWCAPLPRSEPRSPAGAAG